MSIRKNNPSTYPSFYSFLKSDNGADEVIDMFLGKELGSGSFRKVFVFKPDQSLVIKYQHQDDDHSNILEFNFYHNCPYQYKRFLAEPFLLSSSGRFLLQERTKPAIKYPEYVPAFLADLKTSNFGITRGGRFVCHDYAITIPEVGLTEKVKVKKAKFWCE